jgi:hypothetical protein
MLMTELSAAAQAVMTAFDNTYESDKHAVANALRAAADQVVPEEPLYGGDQRWMYERDARQGARKKFLVIADELEGVKYGTYRCDLEKK